MLWSAKLTCIAAEGTPTRDGVFSSQSRARPPVGKKGSPHLSWYEGSNGQEGTKGDAHADVSVADCQIASAQHATRVEKSTAIGTTPSHVW